MMWPYAYWVRLTHKPTGITVYINKERTQADCLRFAHVLMHAKVFAHYSGLLESNERIRTYTISGPRGSHNKAWDHLSNVRIENVADVLNGDLEKVLQIRRKAILEKTLLFEKLQDLSNVR